MSPPRLALQAVGLLLLVSAGSVGGAFRRRKSSAKHKLKSTNRGLTCGDVLFSSYAKARWGHIPHYAPLPCVKIGNQARCVIQCEARYSSSKPDNQQEYMCDRATGWERVRGTQNPACDVFNGDLVIEGQLNGDDVYLRHLQMDGVSKLEGSVAITNSDIAGNSLMAITYYLTEVTGNILIENATRLEHLSAFVRVFDVGGSVTIRDNPQLFSIVPISMMTLSLSLEICNNARLLSFGDNVPTSLPGRVCEGDCECIPSSCSENLCENGGTCESQGEDGTPHCVCVPGYTGIYCHIKTCESDPCLNGGRCIDSPSVGYQCVCPACTYGPTCQALVHTGDVFIDELTVLNDLTDYDQIRVIEGDVRIHNTAATDGQVNNVFPCLNEVRGHLEVSFNSRITELGMFFRLTRVSGSLSVVGNEALYDMFGLDRLETVGGDLDIKYNAAIASLTSIRNLRRVGGRLAISHNPALNNINALPLQTADRLVVTSNARLSAINGLASLTTLNGSLVLADNPRLVQARGLASLRKVGTSLSVKRNPSLEDLGFLAALAPTFSAVCANGPAAAVPVPFAEWVAGRRREFGFSNKACDGNCSCPPS